MAKKRISNRSNNKLRGKSPKPWLAIAVLAVVFLATGFVLGKVYSTHTITTTTQAFIRSLADEANKQEQDAILRQQSYVDYTKPFGQSVVVTAAEKTQQLSRFDNAYKKSWQQCHDGDANQHFDYDESRKINQYANRVVLRSCDDSGTTMYFLNRVGEWQRSDVNIDFNTPSATYWLKTCQIEDIIPNKESQPEDSEFIAQSNNIECDYIAKYRVPMTTDQINKKLGI